MSEHPASDPYDGPPWWLSVILGAIATAIVLAPVWVPIVWEAVTK